MSGVSSSYYKKDCPSVRPFFHPSVRPSCNTLDAYISGVYGPIFAKFRLSVDPPLASAIPGAQQGLTQGGVGQGAGKKKFLRVGKILNLNISRVCLLNDAKPGVLLDIRGGAKHTLPRGTDSHHAPTAGAQNFGRRNI